MPTPRRPSSPKLPRPRAPTPDTSARILPLHQVAFGLRGTANVAGHAARRDSPAFVRTRGALLRILRELGNATFYGKGPVQAHHGGSLWVHDGATWRMFQNLAGIEWSSQFCADPARVDLLRQNARALVRAFPSTRSILRRIGYRDADAVLDTPITSAAGVARFVDSLFNASRG